MIVLKRKIVFVIYSLGIGGAERVLSVLANSLNRNGYDVSIILTLADRIVYDVDSSVKIYNLEGEKITKKTFFSRIKTRIKNLRNKILEINPDIVISFTSNINAETSFALRGIKIPLIVSERNDPRLDPQGAVKRFLRRIAYKRPNGFVFQTPDAQNYFSRKIQKRSRIILNPLTQKLPEPNVDKREKRVVAAGRLEPQKNYKLLLDAFAEFVKTHSEYILEIYGAGNQNISSIIQEKGLQDKVVLKGFLSTVLDDIKTAGMYVLSSDYEGLPNSLMEALALGIPSISTDCPCGGPRLLINNGENGLLVPVNDVCALSKAMSFVADNQEVAKQMSINAVKLRETANIDAITKQWIEYIDDCIKQYS